MIVSLHTPPVLRTCIPVQANARTWDTTHSDHTHTHTCDSPSTPSHPIVRTCIQANARTRDTWHYHMFRPRTHTHCDSTSTPSYPIVRTCIPARIDGERCCWHCHCASISRTCYLHWRNRCSNWLWAIALYFQSTGDRERISAIWTFGKFPKHPERSNCRTQGERWSENGSNCRTPGERCRIPDERSSENCKSWRTREARIDVLETTVKKCPGLLTMICECIQI